MKPYLIYPLIIIITLEIIPLIGYASPVETSTFEEAQNTVIDLPSNTLIAQATEKINNTASSSEIYAPNTASPPHFYVKLQRMSMDKKECKRLARQAMAMSDFTDLTEGKHGVWGVKQGYKAQIKCSQVEQVIAFIVVGQKGAVVMNFSDQLQKHFGTGFPITRDP
jgi:hypothetical protein